MKIDQFGRKFKSWLVNMVEMGLVRRGFIQATRNRPVLIVLHEARTAPEAMGRVVIGAQKSLL